MDRIVITEQEVEQSQAPAPPVSPDPQGLQPRLPSPIPLCAARSISAIVVPGRADCAPDNPPTGASRAQGLVVIPAHVADCQRFFYNASGDCRVFIVLGAGSRCGGCGVIRTG